MDWRVKRTTATARYEWEYMVNVHNCVCLFSPVLLLFFLPTCHFINCQQLCHCIISPHWIYNVYLLWCCYYSILIWIVRIVPCTPNEQGKWGWEKEVKWNGMMKKAVSSKLKKWGKVNLVLCCAMLLCHSTVPSTLNYTHAYWIKWLCEIKEERELLALFLPKKQRSAQQMRRGYQKFAKRWLLWRCCDAMMKFKNKRKN